MTSFRFVRDGAGAAHDRVSVFVGPDADHRALAGVLTMSPSQAEEFLRLFHTAVGGSVELVDGVVGPD